ncbi:MAG: isoprenyl transferase [Clostridia bacterium]|nr:isoprenyl transferase [Clostridia bacterium]
MFTDKLSKLMNNLLRRQPSYITVTPTTPALAETALPDKLPTHVAIIMDGNGRWATERNLPRSAGHAAGTEALREIIRTSSDWGIKHLTIYAFSTENWARSKEEVNALMSLLLKYFSSEIDELDEKKVRILILGDVEGLPEAQRDAVKKAMERTKNNTGLRLNIALNYGGRAELIRAAKSLAEKVKDGTMTAEQIDQDTFAAELYTAGQPDVDLLIRTSGEYRLSNFLPWQTTYAEMVFDKIYWPDFDRNAYLKALREYASRSRRFGGVTDPKVNGAK